MQRGEAQEGRATVSISRYEARAARPGLDVPQGCDVRATLQYLDAVTAFSDAADIAYWTMGGAYEGFCRTFDVMLSKNQPGR